MSVTIPIDDLIRWNDLTATKWRDFAHAHPELLDLPCDIRNSGDVAHLLQHIAAVELRYAERLAGQPETSYDKVPLDSLDALFATHARALDLLRPLLTNGAYDWNISIDFQTITKGPLRASRRDILLRLLLHSVRHYAQLATLVRSHGIQPDWPMDFLFLNASRT